MAVAFHVRKNDTVEVLTGKDKGKRGRVLRVLAKRGRVLVETINMVTHAERPNPQKNIKGGLLPKEAPLHISNVLPVCPACNKPARVGNKVLEDGRGVRICRRCNSTLEK